MTKLIKKVIKFFIPKKVLWLIQLGRVCQPIAERTCPLCGYHGFFGVFGRGPRLDALCPSCRSVERHRQLWLWYLNNRESVKSPILHFAPEEIISNKLREAYSTSPGSYVMADLFMEGMDLRLNMESMPEVPDGSYCTVICNHVLEHVDDKKAISEINRILANDGILICSVPIIEGWEHTYENPDITSPEGRRLHFCQEDHVRFYGRDFRDMLRAGGFSIEEFTAEGEDVVRYGLIRGEKIFICKKSNVVQSV